MAFRRALVLFVAIVFLVGLMALPAFADRPTIILTCEFGPGEDPDLSQAPVELPDDRDRLQSYRAECMANGGHLTRER